MVRYSFIYLVPPHRCHAPRFPRRVPNIFVDCVTRKISRMHIQAINEHVRPGRLPLRWLSFVDRKCSAFPPHACRYTERASHETPLQTFAQSGSMTSTHLPIGYTVQSVPGLGTSRSVSSPGTRVHVVTNPETCSCFSLLALRHFDRVREEFE